MTEEQIKDIFSYHPPTEEDRAKYEQINEAFQALARTLNSVTPDGPGKTAAFHHLADSRMKFNAAIALQGKF